MVYNMAMMHFKFKFNVIKQLKLYSNNNNNNKYDNSTKSRIFCRSH